MPSLVILLCVSGVYLGQRLLFWTILLLCYIVFHLVKWSIIMKTIRCWCDSYTHTHTRAHTSWVCQCPIWGGCHLLVGREHVTSYPTQTCGKRGEGVEDQVSAISHEPAVLCPDPYTSTGLVQLIKVTPSPPTSTPYLRVELLSRCVQFGAATNYFFIYLSISWFFIFRLMAPLFCR